MHPDPELPIKPSNSMPKSCRSPVRPIRLGDSVSEIPDGQLPGDLSTRQWQAPHPSVQCYVFSPCSLSDLSNSSLKGARM